MASKRKCERENQSALSLSTATTMPLASSRSSSTKASKHRMSLPSTIDSSTKVTKSKAMKRRASLRHKRDPSPARRSEDKENGSNKMPRSPGPTPYWKVRACLCTVLCFYKRSAHVKISYHSSIITLVGSRRTWWQYLSSTYKICFQKEETSTASSSY